jgi:hypothetical protein
MLAASATDCTARKIIVRSLRLFDCFSNARITRCSNLYQASVEASIGLGEFYYKKDLLKEGAIVFIAAAV